MDDLDPATAGSPDELAARLKQLYIRADRPPLRELEDRTKHVNGPLPGTKLRRVRLGRTTLSDVLSGRKFPKKAFLLTLVETLGVDLEADRGWAQVGTGLPRTSNPRRRLKRWSGSAWKIKNSVGNSRQRSTRPRRQKTTLVKRKAGL